MQNRWAPHRFCGLMYILCTPYSCILMINLTTQTKSSLKTEHIFILVIIFVFDFVRHFNKNSSHFSSSPSLEACTVCNLYGLQRNTFFRIFHTVVLGTFNSKLERLVDFRGLRTKVSCIFSVVPSATQSRPWSGSLWGTQPSSTHRLYHAVAFILWAGFSDIWSWILCESKWEMAIRVGLLWWLAGFLSSSAWVKCHLAVSVKTLGGDATVETYLIKVLLLVQKLWQHISVYFG